MHHNLFAIFHSASGRIFPFHTLSNSCEDAKIILFQSDRNCPYSGALWSWSRRGSGKAGENGARRGTGTHGLTGAPPSQEEDQETDSKEAETIRGDETGGGWTRGGVCKHISGTGPGRWEWKVGTCLES